MAKSAVTKNSTVRSRVKSKLSVKTESAQLVACESSKESMRDAIANENSSQPNEEKVGRMNAANSDSVVETEKERKAKETSSLLKKYKEAPTKLTAQQKDKLIMEYAPLIKFIAQKIAIRLPSNIELDDLISSGVIGLMDAIDKYDASRDNKFKTYAEFRIRGSILDELRSQDWVPRSVRDKAKLLDRTMAEIEAETGKAPTDEQLSERLNMSMDDFHSLVNQVRPVSVLSIDEQASFSAVDKKSILNLLDGCKLNNPFNQLNLKSVKNIVARAIEELPERQRLVLSLYYYEDLNLKEIGKVLRVTESRVSQLHAQAISRLRGKLATQFHTAELEAS